MKRYYFNLAFILCITSLSAQENDKSEQSVKEYIIPEIDMVYVGGGTITMGCTAEQGRDCNIDEEPAQWVRLSSFYIGKYEVTQKQWRDVMGTNPSYFKGDNLPVERVSWNDVQDFIEELNRKTGKNYRLPTEAEWEYAARGGIQSQGFKYSGGNFAKGVAWYECNMTHPIGTKQANELGIHDMSGNVAEWCGDWYGDYNDGSLTNPQGAASGSDRVSRGGGWLLSAWNVRVSSRDDYPPDYKFVNLGFRLACDSVQNINKDRREVTEKANVNEADSAFTAIPPKVNVNEVDSTLTAISPKVDVNKVDSTFTAISPKVNVNEADSTFTAIPPKVNVNEADSAFTAISPKVDVNKVDSTFTAIPPKVNVNKVDSTFTAIPLKVNVNKVDSTFTAIPLKVNVNKVDSTLTAIPLKVNVNKVDSALTAIPPKVDVNEADSAFTAIPPKVNVNKVDSAFTAIPPKVNVNKVDSTLTAIPLKVNVNKVDSTLTSIPPINMVYVAGGTFTMGCTDEQGDDCYPNETPAHQVTLSPYYIGKYEVTQKQWRDVMGTNSSCFEDDNLPVESVNWDDVQGFIEKLNQKTGKNYRLPTEAEWEYAARGGNQSQGYKYSGGDTVSEVAWYDDNLGDDTSYPVGTKQANELGIYDMSGNVAEWCSDWYGDYNNSSQTNPQGAASGSDRVSRGGGWLLCAWNARVSYREGYSPDSQLVYLGFRLACDAK
ncbi:MAG: formylglycine-generating enzyme family protein [Prevotella sp.]|jgi:formylglycine-generating enzyme required for sulfatase activity|nr:formylglycine-generating enzyme family protein [Prevotella sp.]